MNLSIPPRQTEPGLIDLILQWLWQTAQMHFFDITTTVADHKLRSFMTVSGVTGDKSIKALNFMNEIIFKEKINSAVHGRGLGIIYSLTHFSQNVISRDRLFMLMDYFKYQPSLIGEADALLRKLPFYCVQMIFCCRHGQL